MLRSFAAMGSVVAFALTFGACGKGTKSDFQAAVDSMSVHRDSTVRALDSGRTQRVDTTKLGAAKTESILSKARKSP